MSQHGRQDSNLQPSALETDILPIELRPPNHSVSDETIHYIELICTSIMPPYRKTIKGKEEGSVYNSDLISQGELP